MANILIADDDPILMDLYRLKFTKKGHTVREANKAEGLLAELAKSRPDIILLDRKINDADGLALLGELRKTDNGKDVPVFMLTNMDPSPEDLTNLKGLQPAKYFIKERVDLDELNETIVATVEKK